MDHGDAIARQTVWRKVSKGVAVWGRRGPASSPLLRGCSGQHARRSPWSPTQGAEPQVRQGLHPPAAAWHDLRVRGGTPTVRGQAAQPGIAADARQRSRR